MGEVLVHLGVQGVSVSVLEGPTFNKVDGGIETNPADCTSPL